ncbi:protein FLOWERING LOCUS T-like [Salvia splendens]|uniref:protein FLOWERING LOCUS T-like n=1 Tax=Salvia splendens TaxID=180675 RepID=UPI001C27F5A8|nr:protein FLOWERING LOCUS T-like [Salvia splendens]
MPRDTNPLVVSRVIGDVIDPFTPTTDIQVFIDGVPICNGYRLRQSQVASRPRVDIGGQYFRILHTLVLVDADSPSPANPYLREYLHWLVTDIPSSTNPSFGNEVVPYEAPQPTMGIHRLVMVIFRQPRRQILLAPEWRNNFSIRQLSQVYNLGDPVAAFFYHCHRENGTGGRRA